MSTPAQTHLRIESNFCVDNGFELLEYGDGWAILACAVAPRHTNRRGNAHGGMVSALLDTSMSFAIRSSGRVESRGTASLTVNYLNPARGRIVVLAQLRPLAFCDAEARDEEGAVVAAASAVFSIEPRDANPVANRVHTPG
jgi:uncharacterized protein (TIGR00369 family)